MRTETRHTRRLKAVGLLGMGFALVLAARLVVIQFWASEAYTARARSQHEKQTELRASRGRILDRHGRVLATSLKAQSFFVNRVSELDSLRAFAVRFSRREGKDEAAVLKRLHGKRSFVWLARKVMDGPPEDQLPDGVGRMVEMRRSYPMETLAGQILGFTDIDNVGIEGVELQFNTFLTGAPGEMVSRVDARGETLSAFGEVLQLPEDGADVMLTVDSDYQSVAEEELAAAVDSFQARSGVAIVMQPYTGEILAMADVPLYDPNAFGNYDPEVRRNRAVTDVFEPGSTFKIVAVSAALEEGTHRPDDRIFCENGSMPLPGGKSVRDVHPCGWLTLREVVEKSSNIGAAKVARVLGKGRLNRYIRRFGFGMPTGVALPGEVAGVVRHPSQWSGRSLETLSFGQEVGVTAVQMAVAYCAVANGGQLMVPQILRQMVRGDSVLQAGRSEAIRRVITRKTAATMAGFLEDVVTHSAVQAQVAGYRVAGKTGTAQRSMAGSSGYDASSHISSFIGFLPVERPELLCLVMIDSPNGVHWGSQVAAPVFSRIVKRILSLRKTPLRHRAVAGGGVADDGGTAPQTPVLTGLLQDAAVRALNRQGLKARVTGQGNRVVGQQPGAEVDEVTLLVALDDSTTADDAVFVPDVTGVPLRQAVFQLTAAGLRVKVSGSGWVVTQAPQPGTAVVRGAVCRVTCGKTG